MSVIKITVNDQNLLITDAPKIAAQGVNENYIEFTFSEDWDGFGKTANFYRDTAPTVIYQSVVDQNGYAAIPHEITANESWICIGLSGVKDDVVKTSEILKYKIVNGLYVVESTDPTPDVYEQILALAGNIEDLVTQIETDTAASVAAIEASTASSIANIQETVDGIDAAVDQVDARMDTFIASQTGTSNGTLITETSLFTASSPAKTDITVSDDINNYDYIDIRYAVFGRTKISRFLPSDIAAGAHWSEFEHVNTIDIDTGATDPNARSVLRKVGFKLTRASETSLTCELEVWRWDGKSTTNGVNAETIGSSWNVGIYSITGVKYEAAGTSKDAELTDIRVGADGVTYATAGEAVRTQFTNADNDIQELKEDLNDGIGSISEEIECVAVTEGLSVTVAGVTVENDGGNLKVYGTASGARLFYFVNGQAKASTISSTTIQTADVPAGHYRVETSVSGYSTEYNLNATYSSASNRFTISNYVEPSRFIDFELPATIGFLSVNGRNYGTAENPTIISVSVRQITAVDEVARTELNNLPVLYSVDTSTEDESGKTDMKTKIESMLNEHGVCQLSEGIFYVSGAIDLPEGSTLCGSGRNSEIRLLQSVTEGYCVKIQKNNTIRDVAFSGSFPTNTVATTDRKRNAINFVANYDGATSETTAHCMISNVWIKNFGGSGIYCHNTGISISMGLYVTNAYIERCHKGINIDYYSEFSKFVNVCTANCYIGIVNNGGNNVFTSCTIHATNTGFVIDGTQPNSAHGTINGCTFCHIGSNNGIAVKANDIEAGFIIANSHFWYNSIDLTNCQGILFDGCEFGRGTSTDGNVSASITITGGNLVLFSGCMFHLDATRPPKITITNNTKTVFNGCYGTESGLPITA